MYRWTIKLLLLWLAMNSSPLYANECQRTGHAKEPVCRISMIRLIGTPERYDGKLVSVGGVIRVIPGDGGIELYYSSESFERQAGVEAVYVPPSDAAPLSDFKTGDWISVIAKFDVLEMATDSGPYFGTMSQFIAVAPNTGPGKP